jgi:hypothetical protein
MSTLNDAILKALETWYEPDHKLHNDPLHPAIGLAGEAGELLNLYKKEKFKSGVSWWDCVYCGLIGVEHNINAECNPNKSGKFFTYYTPLILDELGDFWYYLRILAYQQGQDLSEWLFTQYYLDNAPLEEPLYPLAFLNRDCGKLLSNYVLDKKINPDILQYIFNGFQTTLRDIRYSLAELTELNYDKLKDSDNHGWKEARHAHKSQ